jgi:Family of unknown function (DUF6390)
VLAKLTGIADPFDRRLVESYWLGGGVGATVDQRDFGAELLAVIGPRADHYWKYLTPELLCEAAGDHCFHVFGVYPWTRLLGAGPEEPVRVLDSCRIRWGLVRARDGDRVALHWDWLTDRLRPDQVAALEVSTMRQLVVTNTRLAGRAR